MPGAFARHAYYTREHINGAENQNDEYNARRQSRAREETETEKESDIIKCAEAHEMKLNRGRNREKRRRSAPAIDIRRHQRPSRIAFMKR